jgi:hypothetical protein
MYTKDRKGIVAEIISKLGIVSLTPISGIG